MAYRFDDGEGLRDTLLKLAESELERVGYERLSLRALALGAGVAPSAPYRHFSDRWSLLQALAERGFAHLVERYSEAKALDGTPERRLRVAIQGFMDIAQSRPRLYQLMFVADPLRTDSAIPSAASSFAIFEAIVAETPGSDAASARLHSLSLWAALHGAAVLHAGGCAPAMAAGITLDDIVENIARRYVSGRPR